MFQESPLKLYEQELKKQKEILDGLNKELASLKVEKEKISPQEYEKWYMEDEEKINQYMNEVKSEINRLQEIIDAYNNVINANEKIENLEKITPRDSQEQQELESEKRYVEEIKNKNMAILPEDIKEVLLPKTIPDIKLQANEEIKTIDDYRREQEQNEKEIKHLKKHIEELISLKDDIPRLEYERELETLKHYINIENGKLLRNRQIVTAYELLENTQERIKYLNSLIARDEQEKREIQEELNFLTTENEKNKRFIPDNLHQSLITIPKQDNRTNLEKNPEILPIQDTGITFQSETSPKIMNNEMTNPQTMNSENLEEPESVANRNATPDIVTPSHETEDPKESSTIQPNILSEINRELQQNQPEKRTEVKQEQSILNEIENAFFTEPKNFVENEESVPKEINDMVIGQEVANTTNNNEYSWQEDNDKEETIKEQIAKPVSFFNGKEPKLSRLEKLQKEAEYRQGRINKMKELYANGSLKNSEFNEEAYKKTIELEEKELQLINEKIALEQSKKKGKQLPAILPAIIEKRKPKKKLKEIIKKGLPFATIAASLLCLAIGIKQPKDEKISNQENEVRVETTMTTPTEETPSGLEELEKIDNQTDNQIDSQIDNQKEETTVILIPKQEKTENLEENNTIHLGQTISLNEDSRIYSNMYDAYLDENSYGQYYSNSDKRVIIGFGIVNENGMNVVYASDENREEKIQNLLDNGGEITSVLVANQEKYLQDYDGKDTLIDEEIDAYAEGWYNINSIAVQNEKGIKR